MSRWLRGGGGFFLSMIVPGSQSHSRFPNFLFLFIDRWVSKVDRAGNPFMVKDDQWVGYDNRDSIARKVSAPKRRSIC